MFISTIFHRKNSKYSDSFRNFIILYSIILRILREYSRLLIILNRA
ncbi:hypothetical protein SATMO3_32240 [Sporomusa aerivorans]